MAHLTISVADEGASRVRVRGRSPALGRSGLRGHLYPRTVQSGGLTERPALTRGLVVFLTSYRGIFDELPP